MNVLECVNEQLTAILGFMEKVMLAWMEQQNPENQMLETVIVGIIVFFLSERIREVFFVPRQEYAQLKSKVAYVLIMNACYYTNVLTGYENEAYAAGAREVRDAAAQVGAFAQRVPKWKVLRIGIPAPKALSEISGKLTGLSNAFTANGEERAMRYSEHNRKLAKEIRMALNLYSAKDEDPD